MKDATGKWVGWGLGDQDPKVADIQKFLARKYASYAGKLIATGTYDEATADAVAEAQRRLNLQPTGIFNYATQLATGYVKVAAPDTSGKPLLVAVEGHMSDMWHGPVADTMTILEAEGRGRFQPIGYENGSIPFNNQSGVQALYDVYSRETLLDGRPFRRGTKSVLSDFSQGGIVVYDFTTQYLMPGQELDWRTPDILGRLSYGNPTRTTGSAAPWSVGQGGPFTNSGLDPLRRFGLPGNPDKAPYVQMDVFRKGDIFSDNEPTTAGKIKAAVYEVVARGDFWSSSASALAQIADAFKVPLDYVMGAFQAIISGLGFLVKQGDNPHYSPFNIDGGLNWLRGILP